MLENVKFLQNEGVIEVLYISVNQTVSLSFADSEGKQIVWDTAHCSVSYF